MHSSHFKRVSSVCKYSQSLLTCPIRRSYNYGPVMGLHPKYNKALQSKKHSRSNVNRFFVYGTLRDDDNSGAPWTAYWTKNASFCSYAKVYGFKMYKSKKLNYPFALQTNNPNDYITGRLLQWNHKATFDQKLLEADHIENYDENSFDGYTRSIMDVEIIQDGITDCTKAVMYFQKFGTQSLINCDEVPNGDWMNRDLLHNKYPKIPGLLQVSL